MDPKEAKRKPNFTADELGILLSGIGKFNKVKHQLIW